MITVEQTESSNRNVFTSSFDGFEYVVSFISDLRVNLVLISSLVFSPDGEVLTEDPPISEL